MIIIPQSLRELNQKRCGRWHPSGDDDWTLGDWSNAFMGEAGELANVVKKIRRIESGARQVYNTPAMGVLRGQFAEECADTLLYLDLLAWKAGVSKAELEGGLKEKFNLVSVAQGWNDILWRPES